MKLSFHFRLEHRVRCIDQNRFAGFRILQAVALVLAVLVSWLSYARWRTPTAAVKDKLGVEGWVRYASLDVDNTVGDQVRRDKERLVEYRALTRGR